MWNEITTQENINTFLRKVNYFHDSCIKEIRYKSGAYVTPNLSMYPVNDQRKLSMIIQRQAADLSALELEFDNIKFVYIRPIIPPYTCEIFEATLMKTGTGIYWYDNEELSESELDNYDGTIICATKIRWRKIALL